MPGVVVIIAGERVVACVHIGPDIFSGPEDFHAVLAAVRLPETGIDRIIGLAFKVDLIMLVDETEKITLPRLEAFPEIGESELQGRSVRRHLESRWAACRRYPAALQVCASRNRRHVVTPDPGLWDSAARKGKAKRPP